MKLRLSCLLLILPLAVLVASSQSRKYEVKSGIVTYDIVMDMGATKITNRAVVYFDDYGARECRESFRNGKLSESFFSDGSELFTLLHDKKEALIRGAASRGTEFRCSWDEVAEVDKKEGKARKLEPMTIAGKDCETFLVKTANGDVTYSGWKNVLFFMGLDGKTLKMSTKAVKFDENSPVPQSKFTVPSGYTKKASPM
jgi:hypothetical protein